MRPLTKTGSRAWGPWPPRSMVTSCPPVSSASATPWETVSWTYQRVRQQTFLADGVTVVSNVCYDTVVREKC